METWQGRTPMPGLAGPGSSGVAEPWGGGWETVGRGGAGARAMRTAQRLGVLGV